MNMLAFREDLSTSDLICNICTVSRSELYAQYHSTLMSLIDKHAPLQTKKVSRPSEKWLTPEFFAAKRLKRRYERIWRRTRSHTDRSKFCEQVNKCNRILNDSKSKYYTNIVQENRNDPKKLWKCLNNIMHRIPVSILPEDSSDVSLANKFSNYFLDKINNIRSVFIPSESTGDVPPYSPAQFSSFQQVTHDDIRKVIITRTGTHTGADIPPAPYPN